MMKEFLFWGELSL